MNAHRLAPHQRPDIIDAWKRAALFGLDPGMQVRETHFVADFHRRSRLSLAAEPILDRMMEELAGTEFSVLLTDRTARIIDRRVAQRRLNAALDGVLAAPGFQYLEESSGTNALATAYELRRPIAVTGDEHFLESLKQFCCYGAPIIHPITRRVEGVLDITGTVEQSTALLGPFLMRGVHDIERRLLEGARISDRRLLSAFHTHTRSKNHPVLVYGENLILTNPAAADLLQWVDHAALRDFAANVDSERPARRHITLSSGDTVLVTAQHVSDTAGGVLLNIVPVPGSAPRAHVDCEASPPITRHRVRLVIGEPGSGRTTTALEIASGDADYFDAVDAELQDDWIGRVRRALRGAPRVIVDNIHVLAPPYSALLAPAVQSATGSVVLTTSPSTAYVSEHCALAAVALERHELRPLRNYHHDFNARVLDILRALEPAGSNRIAASALNVLAAQPWPGNLRELRSVLEYATAHKPVGAITEKDLPPAYQSPATRPLTLLETAERDAIMSALRASNGNKAAAATQLGIGRTTLYARLRRYRITG